MNWCNIRLGIDLGNVLIDHRAFGTNYTFVSKGDYTSIPPVPGAVASLATVIERGAPLVAVIYNASNMVDSYISGWLRKWIAIDILDSPRFVAIRSSHGRDKSEECKAFGITHFVDDRVEVLNNLVYCVPRRILFQPDSDEKNQHNDPNYSHFVANSWPDVMNYLPG